MSAGGGGHAELPIGDGRGWVHAVTGRFGDRGVKDKGFRDKGYREKPSPRV